MITRNAPYFRPETMMNGRPAPLPLTCTVPREVRFEEVDALNVVWHGRYPSYFEDARVAMYGHIERWLVGQGVADAAGRVDAIARVTLGQAMGFLAQSTLDPGFDQDAYVVEATRVLDAVARA